MLIDMLFNNFDNNFVELFGFEKIYFKKDIIDLLKLQTWIKQNS